MGAIEQKDLLKKKCQPCEGIGQALTAKQAEEYLSKVFGWKISDNAKMISRDFVMKNFMAAIKFINHIATIAESENNHPDIHLTGYRKLRIELSTHALGGLTENDFIVASKINEVPIELKP